MSARAITFFLNAITLVILTNFLAPDVLGGFLFLVGVLLPLSALARLGSNNLVIKDLASKHCTVNDCKWAFEHYNFFVFVLSLFICLVLPFLNYSYSFIEIVSLALGVLFRPFYVLEAIFIGTQRNMSLAHLIVLNATSTSVVRAAICYFSPSLIWYSLLIEAVIIVFGVSLLYRVEFVMYLKSFKFRFSLDKDKLFLGLPFGGSAILMLANNRIDQAMGSSFLTSLEFSNYMLFTNLCGVLGVGVFTLSQYYTPKIIQQNNDAGIAKLVKQLCLLTFCLAFLVWGILAVGGSKIVDAVFPPSYQAVSSWGEYFSLYLVLLVWSQLNGILLLKMGLQKSLVQRTLSAIAIGIPFGLYLNAHMGLDGAIVYTLLCLFFNGVLMYLVFPQLRVILTAGCRYAFCRSL
ncbi:lipopolysaccharide biosynthesis protein [Catenovulum agarivorans]|uniref:lipopolysaccharide biosynthesis protein n=1 Tax=Catenovulum agarivorans TaxID=1172192 RepID=UPI0012F7D6F9|nr:hypothetical protein [Catenovulum agarivorans]